MTQQNDIFTRFEKGNLDLASAFWLFGVVGSFLVGFVGALIAEFLHWIVYIPVFVILYGIVACLYECAKTYIQDKEKKNLSAVWGYLTYVYCGLSVVGLIFNLRYNRSI